MAKECPICKKAAVVAVHIDRDGKRTNAYLCEECVHRVAQKARVEVVASMIPNMPKGYVEGESDDSVLENAFVQEQAVRVASVNEKPTVKPKKKKRGWIIFACVFALLVIFVATQNPNNNKTGSKSSITTTNKTSNTTEKKSGQTAGTANSNNKSASNNNSVTAQNSLDNTTSAPAETDKNEMPTESNQVEAVETDEDFKNSCVTLDYKSVLRYPDDYKGQRVKVEGKVVQVIEGLFSNTMRVSEVGSSDNVWYVTYHNKDTSGRILDDDEITCYGLCDGTQSYTALFGQQITIPSMTVSYISMGITGSSAHEEIIEDTPPTLYNTLTGTGANVYSAIEVSQPTMITLSYPGSRYISVKGYYGSGEYDYDSIFSEIGPYNGTTYLFPGKTYDIAVDVNDSYTLYFETLGTTTQTSFSGTGSTVTSWFKPASNKYHITYSGDDYFSVKLRYGIGEYDYNSLASEIGNYDGIVRVDTGGKNCFLEVSGNGTWSFTPAE